MFQVTDLSSLVSTLRKFYAILLGVAGVYVLINLVFVLLGGQPELPFYRRPIISSGVAVLDVGALLLALYAYRQCRSYGWDLKSSVMERFPRATDRHVALYQVLMAYVSGFLGVVGVLLIGLLAILFLGVLDSLIVTLIGLAVGLWGFRPTKPRIKQADAKLKIEMKKPR